MNPPKCPRCNEPLETVIEHTQGQVYTWNEEKNTYEADDSQVTITYFCPSCNHAIGGWRADGEHWGFVPEFEE